MVVVVAASMVLGFGFVICQYPKLETIQAATTKPKTKFMKLEINNFTGNLTDAMRSAGYHYDGQDPKTGEMRFYRSLSGGLYPRFHIYCLLTKNLKLLTINLHLDQKAPIYKGAPAHGGEYDGPVVEKEAERLRGLL